MDTFCECAQTFNKIANKCMLDVSTFKQRLLSVAMRETGTQAQAADWLLSVLNAWASTVDVLWLRSSNKRQKQTLHQMETIGQNMPTIHSCSHKTCQTCTHAKNHIHTAFTGKHSTAHTVVHKSWTDTIIGPAFRESSNWTDCKHWRKFPSGYKSFS